jgi:hypothetical protein
MLRSLAVCTLSVTIAAGVPAVAAAHPGASAAKSPAAPSAGRWVVDANGATNDVEATAGSFLVTDKHGHRGVGGLRVTIGPQAETACGTGTVRVLGKHKLYEAKGTVVAYDSKYDTWIVGTHNGTGIHPDKVTLSRAGKTFKGKLQIDFIGRRGGKATNKKGGISAGTIDYNSKTLGSCEFTFGIKHK